MEELTSSLEMERSEWAGKEEEKRIIVQQLEQTVCDEWEGRKDCVHQKCMLNCF